MKIQSNKRYVDMYLQLDGLQAENVVFDGCILELWSDRDLFMRKIEMVDCLLVGDGWPLWLRDHVQ